MRKVIQIAAVSKCVEVGDTRESRSTLVVLCDDGAVLQYSPRKAPFWTKFPPVPAANVELELIDSAKDSKSPPPGQL